MDQDFDTCKRHLVERGEVFLEISLRSRERITAVAEPFIRDGAVVLVHGYSRVVLAILLHAAKSKNFSVVVTEGRPANGSGYVPPRALHHDVTHERGDHEGSGIRTQTLAWTCV